MATRRKTWVPDWMWALWVSGGMVRPWLQRLGLWRVVLEEYVPMRHFSTDIHFDA